MLATSARALRKYDRAGLAARDLVAALSGDGPPVGFVYRVGMDIAGMGGTATRASTALSRDSAGLWQSAAIDTLRDAHFQYDTATGLWKRTTLREGAGTNAALGACSFADGTYWATSANFTYAAVTSCISGQVATKHTDSAGSTARTQSVGVFVNAQTDCFSDIFENVDGTTLRYGIRDATAGAYVYIVELTWATKSVAAVLGSGTAGVIDLGTGPNGGTLLRVWITATGTGAGTGAAGNTRQIACQPVITAGKSCIWHHAQFEAATSVPSSPIVTVGAAVTRAADLWSFPWNRVPEAGTWYVDAYDLKGGAQRSVLQVGANSAQRLYNDISAGAWRALLATAAGNSISAAAATPAFGDRLEMRTVIAVSGANATATLGQSVNGAAEAVAAAGTAYTLDATWSGGALYIGANATGGNPANLAIRSILYVPQANYPLSAFRALAGT